MNDQWLPPPPHILKCKPMKWHLANILRRWCKVSNQLFSMHVHRLYLLGWLIRNFSVIHCYFSSHTDRLFTSWSLLSLCSIYLSTSSVAYVCGQLIGWRKARTGIKRCNQLMATVLSSDKCNNATHHLKLMMIRFLTILNLKYNKPFKSFHRNLNKTALQILCVS